MEERVIGFGDLHWTAFVVFLLALFQVAWVLSRVVQSKSPDGVPVAGAVLWVLLSVWLLRGGGC